jgi:hypothetical protein
MKTCAVTIISANYLAYARVLADSIHTHFPEADVVALVVDRRLPSLATLADTLPFRVIWAEDLGLPDFERLAYQFDVLELNTCLKPTFLKHLLNHDYDTVVYWDPDIRLLAHPTPILEALELSSIVLTPHTVKPMMDGRRPSDLDLLRAGCHNLGFVALRNDANARAMLDWWEQRCLTYGFNDPSLGTFVDQKWMDLAPSYFDGVSLLKHRGCNVAYWNLHERAVSDATGSLRVGDEPLVFFHFSGVVAESPHVLSKFQNRHELTTGSVVHWLVQDYCRALRQSGHDEYARLAYTFGTLTNGVPLTWLMRRALGAVGQTAAHPFDADSDLQRRLVAARVTAAKPPARGTEPAVRITAANFDSSDRRVVWLNRLLRLLCLVVGVDRLLLILRYMAFLTRGSNFAAVLADVPFDLSHRSSQSGGSALSRGGTAASLGPTDFDPNGVD